jgi:hypothetical protein
MGGFVCTTKLDTNGQFPIGFARIEFQNAEDAQSAIHFVNGTVIGNDRVVCRLPTPSDTKWFVRVRRVTPSSCNFLFQSAPKKKPKRKKVSSNVLNGS